MAQDWMRAVRFFECRDLVRSQLEGTITMRNRSDVHPGEPGTVVAIELPAAELQRVGL